MRWRQFAIPAPPSAAFLLACLILVAGSFDALTAADLLVITSPFELPVAVVGASYGPITFSAFGGLPPYTWTEGSGGLPAGLTLSLAGVLSGVPEAGTAGSYTLTVRVTDAAGSAATLRLNLAVTPAIPLAITPQTLPTGVQYNLYGPVQFAATGGSGFGYSWSATGLPPNLTMSAAGLLSGTVWTLGPGSFTAVVTVRDSSGTTATLSFPLTIRTAPQVVDPKPPYSAQVNVPYGPYSINVSGGLPPYRFGVDSGLPNGMTVSSAGVLGGTPAPGSEGSYTIQFTVTDSGNGYWKDAFMGFLVSTDPSPLSITGPSALPPGAEFTNYDPVQFTAMGGTGPLSWSATGLPPGLGISNAGVLAGTPGAGSHGAYPVNVYVRDTSSRTATRGMTLSINSGSLKMGPTSLPAGTVGVPYGPVALTVTGGAAPYAFSADSALPAGLSLSSFGVLSGAPASGSAGSYNVAVRVHDSTNLSATASWTILIQASALAIASPSSLPYGRETVDYPAFTFTATGGSGGCAWTATGLPTGLSLSSDGRLTGMPAQGSRASHSVQVTVKDSSLSTATGAFSLIIYGFPELAFQPPLPDARVGVPYSFTLTATGGVAPYRWRVPQGLPYGLTMSPSGVLSGTPTTRGTFIMSVYIDDAGGATKSANVPIAVYDAAVALSITFPPSLSNALEGLSYECFFTASGGSGGYTWSASGLPPGLSISTITNNNGDRLGDIKGAPSNGSGGEYHVTVTVRDSDGATASITLPLVVVSGRALAIGSPATLESLTEGVGGQLVAFTATGGNPPYTWSATGLPPGLSFPSTGILGGVPAAGSRGTYSISFKVQDAIVSTASVTLSLTIKAALQIVGPASLAAASEGAGYVPVTFTATGGSGGYSWTAIGLPTGLSLSTAGVLSGSPASGSRGTYSIELAVRDSSGASASSTVTLVVAAPPITVGPSTLPQGTAGVAYGPVSLTTAGGQAPYAWNVSSGLPDGISLSAAGVLAGTPGAGAAGIYTLHVQVTDANRATGSGALSLTIAAPPAGTLHVSCSPVTGPAQSGIPYVSACTADGRPPYTWTLSGSLPTGLAFSPANGAVSGTPLAPGAFGYTINATDSSVPAQTGSQSYSGGIAPADFTVKPEYLSFSYRMGAAAPPAQIITPSSTALTYMVTIGDAAGCSWLRVQSLADHFEAAASPSGLKPGTNNCNLAFTAGGTTRSVFVVFAVQGPSLVVSPSSLAFLATVDGDAPATQTMDVTTDSGAAATFNATSGCPWLALSPANATTPVSLTLSVNTSGLAANTYTCPITFTTGDTAVVPQASVTLRLNPTVLKVSPLTIEVSATEGSVVPVAAGLALTGPETPLPFTASTKAISGGGWLALDVLTGATPANVRLQADPSGLAAGTYSGEIDFLSGGAHLVIPVSFHIAAVTFRPVPPALAFHFQQGSTPASQIVAVLTSDNSPLVFTVQSNGRINASPGPGAGAVTVSVAPATPAGAYLDDSVTIDANGVHQMIPVSIEVDAPPPVPVLGVNPRTMTFAFTEGGAPATQLLTAINRGSVWKPAVSATSAAGAWLRVSPVPASAADGEAVPISITADPSKISDPSGGGPGTYSGEIVVSNAATKQEVAIAVTMVVNQDASVTLSRLGLAFTVVQNGAPAPAQTIDVLSSALGLQWTADASTLSGGSWLRTTPASGTSAGGASPVAVEVDRGITASLPPGAYYGSLTVRAASADTGIEAANSPQTVTVVLNVLPAGTDVTPSVHPGTLVLSGTAGGTTSAPQIVTIDNPNSAPASYTAATVSDAGTGWCSASPAKGTVSGSASIGVQAAFQQLAAGVHSCTLQLSFSDGGSQSIPILALASAPAAGSLQLDPGSNCAASGLVVGLREPAQRARIRAFQPVGIEVDVRDGCGKPVTDAAVSASFSSGDDAVVAQHVGNGLYRAAWIPTVVPRNVPETEVAIYVAAQAGTGDHMASGAASPASLTVQLGTDAVTSISPGGVMISGSFARNSQVSPCGWISIFGENLAEGAALASDSPLPFELEGAHMDLGGLRLPIRYASTGQINAQIPCGVPPNTEQNLQVVRGSTRAMPAIVVVASATPALFTTNQEGSGQAAAFWTMPDGGHVSADVANPAPAGSIIEIYCTGLGAVNPAVAEGTLTPLDHLTKALLPVAVTFGGVPAAVQFAGLMPGGIGIYQVNATVPPDAPSGPRVPIVVSVNGHESQSGVSVAIR